MYSQLDRHDVKALNRIDKRRRMKYDARRKENDSAEELRAARREVGQAEERYEGQQSRLAHRYASNYR